MKNLHKRQFVLILSSILILFVVPTNAFAVDFDEQFYSSNDILFYDPRSGGTCSVSADDTTLFTGKDNREKTWNFLRSKGLSVEQTAGAFGNLDVESAGTFDPEIVQGGGRNSDPSGVKSGWGIMQWTPGSKIIGLMKNANIASPPNEITSQLELVWWHMNNTSPTGVKDFYGSTYKDISNVDEATESFMLKMEAPGIPHLENRKKSAQKALEKYGSNDVVDSQSASDTCSNQLTAGGSIKGDDYKECSSYLEYYSGICNGQCVSFVLFRLLKHKVITQTVSGNGKDIVGSLGAIGFPVSTKPTVNAVFSTSHTSQPQYGHTGIVSKVNDDGSIVIEEYNYSNRLEYGTRTVTKAAYEKAEYTFADVGSKYQ